MANKQRFESCSERTTEKKERAKKRKQRADKKLMENAEKKRTSKSTLYRSVSRMSKVLPNSPRLKGIVLKKLVHIHTPNLLRSAKRIRLDLIIDKEVREKVQEFYIEDGISYQAPGKKDFVICKDENGEKVKRQVKYMTMKLKEAFSLFKADYPTEKVALSRFFQLQTTTCEVTKLLKMCVSVSCMRT